MKSWIKNPLITPQIVSWNTPKEVLLVNNMSDDWTWTNEIRKAIFWLVILLLVVLFISGCRNNPVASIVPQLTAPTSTSTTAIRPTVTTTPPPAEEQVISTPTLAPTATPGPLDLLVEDLNQHTGIDQLEIFGLNGQNLVNFLISLILVVVGSLAGWLFVKVVIWLAKFTPPSFDDQLLITIKNQLVWLIALFFLEFGTARLTFLSPETKQWLDLIYFAVFIIVVALLILKAIEYGLEGPLTRAATPKNRDLIVTFLPLLYRLIQVGVVIASLAIILQNFGFNLSALLAILGLGGLAVSLAAKETLEDMINGFIILIDRPYQIGDRIKIETMDTWGDVENIGVRTTRIRTLDNRLVIVPNSVIGRNQVENYTYPDSSYRVDVQVGIGYGSDIDQVVHTIEGAVLSVSGIYDAKPPFVELAEFGDSALIFRVLYWLDTYADIRLKTKVNKAIYRALTAANIEMPFITYDVNLAYKAKMPNQTTQ
jgi:small-conductance mechanosensitive channel